MKAYRVMTGHGINEYGYSNNIEEAHYFFNEAEAKEFYKTGEFTTKETKITTTFKDGYVSIGYTGAGWYERELKTAGPNVKVELVEKIYNRYRFEEIEIK